MTPDIERLAKEAGALVENWLTMPPKAGLFYFTPEMLAKFAHLLAEECAKLCELEAADLRAARMEGAMDIEGCAYAIRAKFALSNKE